MDIKNDLNDNLNKIYKLSNENKELKEELNNKDELLDVAEKKINKLQLERHQENLEKANQSSTELKEKTSDKKMFLYLKQIIF